MRKAVVSYDMDWSDDEKQTALLMGLDDVLGELLEFHGWPADTLIERCGDVIEGIADDIAQERKTEGVD